MSNAPTSISKLPSGVEFEIKEFTGKHQRLLTEQGKKSHNDKLNELLKDLLVRVGSLTTFDDEFFMELLAADRKEMLVHGRQFTMGFDPTFRIRFPYTDKDGEKQEYTEDVPLDEGHFPMKPMMVEQEATGEDGNTMLVPASFEEYVDVIAHKRVRKILPSGLAVEFTHLDGRGELIGVSTKKSEVSAHTPLKMRRPVYFEQKENTNIAISLNLDRLSYKDISALRIFIKDVEGRVDTEISIEHPEAQFLTPSEQEVVIDVMGSLDFFFPSGVI